MVSWRSGTLLFGVLLVAGGPRDEPAGRPNFVFLLADDLGWRDLGAFGSTFYETPNLDRLATSGVRFTQAYATCQVCSPTRASIFTGKYPARMNTTDYFGGRRKGKLLPAEYVEHLPLAEVTLAEALQEGGYATFFAGKWHLGGEGFAPEDQGFETNVGGHRAGMPRAGYFSPYENPKLADGPEGEHLTDRLTAASLEFLRQEREQPFLLFLSYYSVHTPLQAKPELVAKYEAKAAALAPVEPRFLPEGSRQARQVQDHAVYAGMVETLDTSVGRILDELDALGLADETIVVFMSDNGGLSTSEGSPTSNVPLRAGKGWMYEGGIREPLIVRWPGAGRAGAVCSVPVTATDFYPTLLEMAGLPARPEQHVDGTSFAALVRDPGAEHERAPLFWHYPHYGNQGGRPAGAIRAGDLKLIEWFEDGRLELFDLAADVGERTDLAPARPADVARLHAELRTWRGEVDARMPRPNPDYEVED